MKNFLTITSTLIIGCALALTACNKDKKPAKTEPTAAEPAKEPAAGEAAKDPAAGEPKADEKPKSGW